MKKVIFGFIILIVFLLTFVILQLNNRVFPNTTLSQQQIGFKSSPEIKKQLDQLVKKPIVIIVNERQYKFAQKDLGIMLNQNATLDAIFEPNNKPIITRVKQWFSQLKHKQQILPVLTFSPDFYLFTQTIFDFSKQDDQIVIDNINKSINLQENSQKLQIDADNLRAQIVFNYSKQPLIITPLFVKLTNEQKQKKLFEQNQRLRDAFSQPLQIVMDRNGSLTKQTIPVSLLKEFISINYSPDQTTTLLTINQTPFDQFYSKQLALYFDSDVKLIKNVISQNVLGAMTNRVQGISTDVVFNQLKETANTNGEKAQKYIEIDISQQAMYLFENSNLIARHRISSGLYKPTPRGEFALINKANNAYSDIYHVWMSYWMAFYYEKETNSYYGIHELPYWVSGDGQKIQRPREFLGSPHTGGCVSLDIGIAKQVYDWSETGLPVYIYD
ncbi:hypothetical protein CO083_01255 [Candidatus Roizmanbacteria bacterium CG_4_9_14_0_8_um_filter_34_12]|uniref:L,D-TPase catalytic domain-containing protein n=1 Tax=Candidatus Roizmanbacteria bacterium CG_4_9_14_0_8_um_filter_34_12 TaxID=1974840 RepID=A0A2M8DDQ2_9BACT|nr:MAG: hypothetical protein CO083_01255 [Candidatus Roizmanbacteria bacterium CG_4_9_14_0_8_um_filter_34_12]